MIEIIWLKEVKGLRDPIALVGMPGIASVGKLAISSYSKLKFRTHNSGYF